MEKKFTRAMVCKEFHPGKCKECPLNSGKNPKSLPCWLLDESDIQNIMKDYPYTDVKVRMIFNDIETRLTAVEKKVEKKDEPKFTMFPVVAKKLYDELESKHESDCRLISEYDLEIKRLKEEISTLNKQIDSFGLTCRLYEKETKNLKSDVERWVERHNRLRDMDKSKLFDLKNAENERDHYKGLYSSKCDDYDKLLEKQIKTEKELKHAEEVGDNYKLLYDTTCDNYDKLEENYNKLLKDYKLLSESNNNHATDNFELEGEIDALSTRNAYFEKLAKEYKDLFHSLNHKHQNVVGEMKHWKERAMEAEKNEDYLKRKLEPTLQKLKETEEKLNDARVFNKMREDVFEANLKLKKTIEAKDREIGLLRAELDKYRTDDECDDSWID